MPAILKIIIVFVVMLFLARTRIGLGTALLFGGLVLNLWAGLDCVTSFKNFGLSLINLQLWLLIIITTLIMVVSRHMTKDENARSLVSAIERFGGRHGRIYTLVAMPAMMGMMPMPAGALFSAPFVDQAGGGEESNPCWRTAVNYWFRHIWEYWSPLYPGVIVAMDMFNEVPTWQFLAVQMPFTVVAVVIGLVFLILPHRNRLMISGTVTDEGRGKRALFLMVPLLIVIVSLFTLPFLFEVLWPSMNTSNRQMLALLAGLVVSVVLVMIDEGRARFKTRGEGKDDPGGILSEVFNRKSLSVQYAVAGVMVFKGMLERSDLLIFAGEELTSARIPVIVAVAALPFIAGMVTGLAIGFSGTAFPLVVGLVAARATGITQLSALPIAFGFGYMGMMLSPVHLCLVVTRKYFGAGSIKTYREYMPCVIATLVYSIAVHVFLRVIRS